MAVSTPGISAAATVGGVQPSAKRWPVWIGRVLSAIPVLMMGISGVMKLMHIPEVIKAFTSQFGYPESTIMPIGIIELMCVVLYIIPQTAILGAIVTTGYLGGAIATHVRILDPSFIAPLILGILIWVGLYLREPRLRPLAPRRQLD